MAVVSPASKVEAAVIGAGVVGIAVARALAALGREVLLLDRADRIGAETSSRNSEVVHAGLYYPPDSYKAKMCVRGRQLLYNFCEDRAIDFEQCGKLVVAANDSQAAKLDALHRQALANGVNDVQLISTEQVHEMEPRVRAPGGALWSPSTGIVDSHAFMVSLLADFEEIGDGSILALHSNVEDAQIGNKAEQNRVQILVSGMWLSCGILVNCAGLWADQIARTIHRHDDWQPPTQRFCKGNYFQLQGQKAPFSHLIYPLPDERGGLGVHATIDLGGQVRFGPDVEWLDDTDPDTIDLTPDPDRATNFYSSIRTYWPELKDGALIPDYSGVRPKLYHPCLLVENNKSSAPVPPPPFFDFVVAGPSVHHVPGLVHLFGIESPGLTSAMAIAEHVVEHELSAAL